MRFLKSQDGLLGGRARFEHASFSANHEVRNDRTEKEGEAEIRIRFVLVIFSFSTSPTKEGIDDLNDSMSKKLNEITVKKESSLIIFLRSYNIPRHVLCIGGITVLAGFVYFLGVNHLMVPKEASFPAAVTLWGILTAGYFQHMRKTTTSRGILPP